MFICRGSEWEAETQGSPGQLFPPVPFLADTIQTSYMKMGGGGGLVVVRAGFIHCRCRVFACPACAYFPLAPFPGRETEKGQYSRLRPGKQRAPCPRQPGQSAEPASQACFFLLLFLLLCFFLALGGWR